MKLVINGVEQELPENISVSEALTLLKYESQSVAIACNETFVPRHAYPNTLLKSGDSVEVLTPMQGG